MLATHGIPTQTQKQVEPIKIRPPGDILMKVYGRLGENKKLGLTGRPLRPLGALATSRVIMPYLWWELYRISHYQQENDGVINIYGRVKN